jgi:tetratricopeptide (TPR) repeat protein
LFVRKKLLCTLALAASLPTILVGCATTYNPLGAKTSWTDKVSASVKNGSTKVAAALAPQRHAPDDPLPPPNGKPGPAVFVAMAQMNERNDHLDEAEVQYKKALDLDPNYAAALVGYARLEDRRNNLEAATKLYQRAAKKHPKDASVQNDLGLCYHRRGMLDEAAKSLRRAVELGGENKLYRDNLAAVYVEHGKTKEALAQLTAAHGEAIGHYNLAFLLEKKQNHAEALTHFQKAAENDPSLTAAHQWIAKISGSPSGSQRRQAVAVHSRGPLPQAESGSGGYAHAADQPPSSFMPASGTYPAEPASVTVANRGIQYPQARVADENAADAMAPAPSADAGSSNRLPGIKR